MSNQKPDMTIEFTKEELASFNIAKLYEKASPTSELRRRLEKWGFKPNQAAIDGPSGAPAGSGAGR